MLPAFPPHRLVFVATLLAQIRLVLVVHWEGIGLWGCCCCVLNNFGVFGFASYPIKKCNDWYFAKIFAE